jgi:hypothetical protein
MIKSKKYERDINSIAVHLAERAGVRESFGFCWILTT